MMLLRCLYEENLSSALIATIPHPFFKKGKQGQVLRGCDFNGVTKRLNDPGTK
jgi:hypothetical protein